MKKQTIMGFAIAMLLGTSAHASCYIEYNCGKGATGTAPADLEIDSATKVFTPSGPGGCTKSGQVFTHWQVSYYYAVNDSWDFEMTDAAWAGTEYAVPFTTASDTCSSKTVTLTLTAQWVDATYTGIPTSKSYVDTGLNAKQPKFAALGNDKLMLYSNTTNGATLSRDIVTTLGDSTSDISVPTRSAVNAGLAAKQDTLQGDAGYIIENSGTSGDVRSRPVYSTTANYKSALVEAEDLNQMIMDAVNSELTQVADGWRINDSVTLPTLRRFFDPVATGAGPCYCNLIGTGSLRGCGGTISAALGATNSKSGKWGDPMPYGGVVGKSVCSETQGTKYTVATNAQESSLNTEFSAQSGVGSSALRGNYCWCKTDSVDGEAAVSRWVYLSSLQSSCVRTCAMLCGSSFNGDFKFRSSMLSTIQ